MKNAQYGALFSLAGRKIGVSNIIRGLQLIGEYDPNVFE